MSAPTYVDDEGRPSDSAGQAWAGKTIPSTGFEGDTGEMDPALASALDGNRQGPTSESETELVARVAANRWLVPVVAVAAEVDSWVDGRVDGRGEHAVETKSDMAAVTLTAPNGSRGLPMFSSIAALAEWDPQARPVPVRAAAAAQSAVAEGCDVLLVDVASEHATVLRSSMLWALAQERPWLPAHRDEHVLHAVETAVRGEVDVLGHRLEAGEPAGAGALRVVLTLRPGLDRDRIGEIATRVGERIATDGEARARIDALTFALEAAG
jgi:hypothetical protein